MGNNSLFYKLLIVIVLISCIEARSKPAEPIDEEVSPKSRRPSVSKSGECQINMKTDLPSNQPLLLRKGGTKDVFGFLMPDKDGVINMKSGQQFIVACPGKNNRITKIDTPQTTATCDSGQFFTTPDLNKQLIIKDFNCSSFVQHSAQKNPSEKCEIPGDYNIIDIGFELPDKSYYTIMKTCFDEKNLDSIYAKFIQPPSISAAQTGEPRPSFAEGTFYPSINVNSKYVKEGQKATFAEILGSKTLADKYIGEGDYYLARGHLTARADYIFSSQQRATFWYINVAPQWQTFNGGNWMQLESSVRSYTAKSNQNITIYTGTHGIATLPDINNNQQPLYLYIDHNNNNGKIKVPEVFWKVLYEPKSQKGIAFVGINNPYLNDFTPLCNDVCYQVNWLRWQPNKQKLGFGYCCDVNELRESIKTIPKLKIQSLLT